MSVHVIIRDCETGKSKMLYTCENTKQANHIVETFNRLNVEAAKMTGTFVKFVYSVILK